MKDGRPAEAGTEDLQLKNLMCLESHIFTLRCCCLCINMLMLLESWECQGTQSLLGDALHVAEVSQNGYTVKNLNSERVVHCFPSV